MLTLSIRCLWHIARLDGWRQIG